MHSTNMNEPLSWGGRYNSETDSHGQALTGGGGAQSQVFRAAGTWRFIQKVRQSEENRENERPQL